MSDIVEGGGLFNNDAISREATEATRQNTYEEAVVKRIVRRHRDARPALQATARERGIRIFSFDALQTAFPKFPLQLGAAKLAFMHKIDVPDLFGASFLKTQFFRAYQKWLLQAGLDDREVRVGFVFNWPAISDQMVLHNYPVTQDGTPDPDIRRERGTRIVRPYGRPLVIYVIETMDDFLDNLGDDWLLE